MNLIPRPNLAAALLCGMALHLAGPARAAADPYHGGKPAAGAKPSVADLEAQVYYQRAFEAVVWGMPLVNTYRLRLGIMEGNDAHDNDMVSFSHPAVAHHELLTANNTTPYVTANFDLRKGPVVIEVPARTDKALLFGQIIDALGVTMESVGPAGVDQGHGGKYLLVPPGYTEALPEGYIPVRSTSNYVALAFRPVHAPNSTDEDALAYGRTVRIYSLADAANPPPTRIIDGFPNPAYTLPRYDLNYFRDLHEIINAEPVRTRDKVMMGMLASIGIERGKPFKPQGKVKAAMERAVVDAWYYMQGRSKQMASKRPYWPSRHWGIAQVSDPNDGFEFETADALLIDERADIFHAGSYFPKKMQRGKVPVMYLVAFADSQGRPFQRGADYRLHIPADTPAAQFWSLVPYDEDTWAFVYNDLKRAGLSSFDKQTLKANPDGSIDIYFGTTAPKGIESNWIPMGHSIAAPVLRLYGVTDALWSGKFTMPDVERIR
ncbi:MAG: DUF1254 domain-containing protein [Burkholderiaceae bacterium]|nr:DUF1254 domain-containing protein [Burkholderiaceae bacterium]